MKISKYSLNLKLNKSLDAKLFKFKKNCACSKYSYKTILQKSNIILPVLIVKKTNKWKPVYKSTLNQFYCMQLHKRKNSDDYNIKTKNVLCFRKRTKGFFRTIGVLCIGLIIGFINGFWGGGGGMICVPTLTGILKLKDKSAHATAILIMLPLSIASFVVYLVKGSLDWSIAGFVTGGFVLGGLLGAMLLKKINNIVLQIIFAIVIIAGGIKILL